MDPLWHVVGMANHRDAPAGPGDAGHFGAHTVRIDALHHGAGHGDVKVVIRERYSVGTALAKLDAMLYTFLAGQRGRFLYEKTIDVDRHKTVSSCCAPRHPAIEYAGATADF